MLTKIEIWHIKFYPFYFPDKFSKLLFVHDKPSLFKCTLEIVIFGTLQTYLVESENIKIIFLKVKSQEMVLTIANELFSTFLSGHFLFDMCTVYGLVPAIVSVDLYQSSCSSVEFKIHGNDAMSAYIPVEITLLTISSYSHQSLAITSLRDISWQSGSVEAAKNCVMNSPPGQTKGVMPLLSKSLAVSTGSSQLGVKRTVKQLERRKWRMNPPNTAQTVKTRLLDKVLPLESLLSLSVTLGMRNK